MINAIHASLHFPGHEIPEIEEKLKTLSLDEGIQPVLSTGCFYVEGMMLDVSSLQLAEDAEVPDSLLQLQKDLGANAVSLVRNPRYSLCLSFIEEKSGEQLRDPLIDIFGNINFVQQRVARSIHLNQENGLSLETRPATLVFFQDLVPSRAKEVITALEQQDLVAYHGVVMGDFPYRLQFK